MSYCCSICGNLDRAGCFEPLDAVIAHYGWSGLAKILQELTEDEEVQASYALLLEKREAERVKAEERHLANEERKRLKRQKKRTRQMFRPPYADNMVLPPDALMIQETLL